MEIFFWFISFLQIIKVTHGTKLIDFFPDYGTDKSTNPQDVKFPAPSNPPTPEPSNPPTPEPSNPPTPEPSNPPTPEPSNPPTPEPFRCSLETKEYQLKMFWEKGMEWQQSRSEKAWCAECDKDCDSGEEVNIRECDDDEEEQFWLFYNCTVRPSLNPDVCFTTDDRSDLTGRIKLRDCGKNGMESEQKFRMYDSANVFEKFQFKLLKPVPEELCLTQEHHPRDKESLRFVSCRTALENDPGVNDDTSHWVVGAFDGHR